MSKAFLISPQQQTIEPIELADTDEVAALIGFETIDSEELGSEGDRLFFDEECFIRGSSGRFQIDNLIPVAGKGVVVGVSAGGTRTSDVSVSLDDLRSRTRFQ